MADQIRAKGQHCPKAKLIVNTHTAPLPSRPPRSPKTACCTETSFFRSLSLSLLFFISPDHGRAIVPSADRSEIKRERLKDNFFLINSYKSGGEKIETAASLGKGTFFDH